MRVAAGAVILTVLPLVEARTALALVTGRGTGTITASAGTWSAVATTTGSPPYGPVSLTFTKVKGQTSPQYLWIDNTGSLDLTGVSTTLSLGSAGSGTAEICSTGWNETTGTCSGSTTTLATGTSGATSTPLPLAVGGQVRVKVTAAPAKGTSITVTIDVSVPGGLVRPPTTANS